MRIKKAVSKNSEHYSIIYDVKIGEKRTTKIYENIGNYEKLKARAGNEDPEVWLNNYLQKLNDELKEDNLPVIIKRKPNKQIGKNEQIIFNGGYLFLQEIYYSLGLNSICKKISEKYEFKYDLNLILSNLLYSRVIFPSSKLKTHELSKSFIEKPNFKIEEVYRSLEVIAKEKDFIQAELYKNSVKNQQRNNNVLFYDCTNFYFESEDEEGIKQYGKSKENRPNPIVQMGLFMDGDGIPLAFDITPGNTNEQKTLIPLEEKIIKDFGSKKIIICTDAGLASTANRKFNNSNERRFITTQSIKKLKSFLKDEAVDLTKGWKLPNNDKEFDISRLKDDEDLIEAYYNSIFYKERWIKENGLEQRLIVTYSVKYQEYQKRIRNRQIERAQKIIEKNPGKLEKAKQNDPKRFIQTISTTSNGEVAENNYYEIDNKKIIEEAKYDGLYAVCTNLEDDVKDIIEINKRRWEIEESFRIMKTEFKARPVYLKRDDRIVAHFVTCFLALILLRYLEKKIDLVLNKINQDIPDEKNHKKYSAEQIIELLRNYNFKNEIDIAYSPIYKRTDLTDIMHEAFQFKTDYEVIKNNKMNKIIKQTKK